VGCGCLWRAGGAEGSCLACFLHQAAPPFLAALRGGDRAAAGQAAVAGAVGQCPLRGMPLQIGS
jgi:hypothetical protein